MQTQTVTAARDTRLRLLAALVSLLAVSLFAVRGTYAVFSATTDNQDNGWAAGELELENDPDGDGTFGASTTAEFSETLLIPGDSGTGCIDVRYVGTVTDAADLTNVVLYVSDIQDTDGGGGSGTTAEQLSDDLDIQVSIYAAGETCATVSPTAGSIQSSTALASMGGTYASGIDTGWEPSGSDTLRAFAFTWTLGTDTAEDAQGDAVTADFIWEVQTP